MKLERELKEESYKIVQTIDTHNRFKVLKEKILVDKD